MRIDHVHPRTLNKQDEGGRRYAEYFSSNKAQRQADHSPESGGSLTLSVAVACKDQSAMKSFYHSGLPQESYPNWPVVYMRVTVFCLYVTDHFSTAIHPIPRCLAGAFSESLV